MRAQPFYFLATFFAAGFLALAALGFFAATFLTALGLDAFTCEMIANGVGRVVVQDTCRGGARIMTQLCASGMVLH